MLIQSALRLKPFTHLPGKRLLLPSSGKEAQIFPTCLLVEGEKIPLPSKDWIEAFTVQLDIERSEVFIVGKRDRHLIDKGSFLVSEKLALGVHKKQCLEGIWNRMNLAEIFPMLYALSSSERALEKERGLSSVLIQEIEVLLKNKKHDEVEKSFVRLLKARFRDFFVPVVVDDQYQGIVEDEPHLNAHKVLFDTGNLIRSLFIKTEGNVLHLLPHLIPSLPSGRFLHIEVPGLGHLDIEWTKGKLRRAVLRADTSGEWTIVSPGKKGCRLQKNKTHSLERIFFEAKTLYYLDHFA